MCIREVLNFSIDGLRYSSFRDFATTCDFRGLAAEAWPRASGGGICGQKGCQLCFPIFSKLAYWLLQS
jgi:hypothetical protein